MLVLLLRMRIYYGGFGGTKVEAKEVFNLTRSKLEQVWKLQNILQAEAPKCFS